MDLSLGIIILPFVIIFVLAMFYFDIVTDKIEKEENRKFSELVGVSKTYKIGDFIHPNKKISFEGFAFDNIISINDCGETKQYTIKKNLNFCIKDTTYQINNFDNEKQNLALTILK